MNCDDPKYDRPFRMLLTVFLVTLVGHIVYAMVTGRF